MNTKKRKTNLILELTTVPPGIMVIVKKENRYIGACQNDDNDNKHCDDVDDDKDDDNDDDWLCGKYLWKI